MLRTLAVIAAVASPLAGVAAAQSGSVLSRRAGADLSFGTTGVGANVQLAVHDRVVLRGQGQWLEATIDDYEEGGVTYGADLASTGVAAFADLHPFANGFTLTGGVFVGDRSADLDATPQGAVRLGGQSFTPDQVGTLTGGTEFPDASLFAGLGWDGTLYGRSRLSLVARAGVMFLGDPDVTLSATRTPDDPTGELRASLDREEAELEDEIGDYAYYPVVTVGIGYGF